jgi:predicted DNA-binding transcriptional regulator AlpA
VVLDDHKESAFMSAEFAKSTLTETEAADYTGMSVHYLRVARLKKPRADGPPFVRLGRSVRYLVKDLDRWLTKNRVVRRRDRP